MMVWGCNIYAVNYWIVTFKVRAIACLGQEKPKIRKDSSEWEKICLHQIIQELKRVQKKASLWKDRWIGQTL